MSATIMEARESDGQNEPEPNHFPTSRKEDSKGHQLIDNENVKGGSMVKEATVKV